MSSTSTSDMMPSQNEGVAMPAIATMRTIWSSQVFSLRAEIVPSGMAIRTAITVAISAICSDTGRRLPISWATRRPDHIDVPKSNVKKLPRKSRNCTIRGLSSPRDWRQASIAPGLPCEPAPRRITQMSPGTRRIRTKTRAAAPTRVGTASNRRVTT
jgi:hypothetical protein